MAKIPIPRGATTAPKKNPVASATEPPKRFSFSMTYFRQIEYFGVSEVQKSWFVSLFERLQELGNYTVDGFLADTRRQDDLRYHVVDWMHKNVPISRNDLNWLPKEYLENEVEYPIVQFMVSLGTGRVVGFLDEGRIFQVVLLDPCHNIQPAKRFEYRVDDCFPVASEIGRLQRQIDTALATISMNSCDCASVVQKTLGRPVQDANVVVLCISDQDMIPAIEQLRARPDLCLTDVFVAGLLHYME